eukprot:1178243-Prorocentrum_minimum.AAC.4
MALTFDLSGRRMRHAATRCQKRTRLSHPTDCRCMSRCPRRPELALGCALCTQHTTIRTSTSHNRCQMVKGGESDE